MSTSLNSLKIYFFLYDIVTKRNHVKSLSIEPLSPYTTAGQTWKNPRKSAIKCILMTNYSLKYFKQKPAWQCVLMFCNYCDSMIIQGYNKLLPELSNIPLFLLIFLNKILASQETRFPLVLFTLLVMLGNCILASLNCYHKNGKKVNHGQKFLLVKQVS